LHLAVGRSDAEGAAIPALEALEQLQVVSVDPLLVFGNLRELQCLLIQIFSDWDAVSNKYERTYLLRTNIGGPLLVTIKRRLLIFCKATG